MHGHMNIKNNSVLINELWDSRFVIKVKNLSYINHSA
jgi:hypothetical protein